MENAFNAVPAKAEYTGPRLAEVQAALERHHFAFEATADKLTVLGKSVHAMNAPQGTCGPPVKLPWMKSYFAPLHFLGQVFKEDATWPTFWGGLRMNRGN